MAQPSDGFKNLLAFLILMANDKILTKSPDYIIEKYQRYLGPATLTPKDSYLWGLDSNNSQLFDDYIEIWFSDAN